MAEDELEASVKLGTHVNGKVNTLLNVYKMEKMTVECSCLMFGYDRVKEGLEKIDPLLTEVDEREWIALFVRSPRWVKCLAVPPNMTVAALTYLLVDLLRMHWEINVPEHLHVIICDHSIAWRNQVITKSDSGKTLQEIGICDEDELRMCTETSLKVRLPTDETSDDQEAENRFKPIGVVGFLITAISEAIKEVREDRSGMRRAGLDPSLFYRLPVTAGWYLIRYAHRRVHESKERAEKMRISDEKVAEIVRLSFAHVDRMGELPDLW